MLLEEPNTVGSVESYVMQVLVQLDLDGCILVRVCRYGVAMLSHAGLLLHEQRARVWCWWLISAQQRDLEHVVACACAIKDSVRIVPATQHRNPDADAIHLQGVAPFGQDMALLTQIHGDDPADAAAATADEAFPEVCLMCTP